jgi:5-methylcytosine-specific restriction enzyme A
MFRSVRELLILGAMLLALSGFAMVAAPPEPKALEPVPAETVKILSQPELNSRSIHWPAVRKAHLEKESVCRGCGSKHDLQVHHLKPFHLRPDLELEEANLATVCRMCHFVICHLNGWNRENPNADQDLKAHRKKVEAATAVAR